MELQGAADDASEASEAALSIDSEVALWHELLGLATSEASGDTDTDEETDVGDGDAAVYDTADSVFGGEEEEEEEEEEESDGDWSEAEEAEEAVTPRPNGWWCGGRGTVMDGP